MDNMNQPLQDRLIWVRSDQEVETYPMVPNTRMQFWNMYEPVAYIKRVDQYGRTTSIDTYDIVKRTSQQPAQVVSTWQDPPQQYAPAEVEMASAADLRMLQRQVDQMSDMLRSIQMKLSRNDTPPAQNRKESKG